MPPPPQSFGSNLQIMLDHDFHMTPQQLADKAGVPIEELYEYLAADVWNDRKPLIHVAEKLADALELEGDRRDYFLRLAVMNDLEARQWYSLQEQREREKLDLQTRQSVAAIASTAHDLVTEVTDPKTKEKAERIADGLETLNNQLLTRVRLPSQEAMEVQLVPIADVQRLEEYRADQNKFASATTILLGVVTGIIVNVVTGGEMTPVASALALVAGVATLFLAAVTLVYVKRGNEIREKFLGERIRGSIDGT